ncbi:MULTISPECIES: EVE domain-containing protein [unclassified Sphingomonas]|uniref:EVE domain-containing protein n=1 Tax=unclassified Sphingomonas TaxID=196159 RepID=UPI000BD082BA|nr:MAG: ubiquinol-cytochrome C reductase [Sphingomonas sp. 12-62-6]OYX37561.1 MAG: ubiquinol-cytochrome C reductase [Sphingomonas sp. 32-62-10]
MANWLIKSEPESYGWAHLVADGHTEWTGVRNHSAAINLRGMAVGDEAFFYHSVSEKAVVGIVRVTRAWQPDGEDGKWASVEVEPVRALARPVTLASIKAEAKLAGMALLRQSRLSVCAVTAQEWAVVMTMGE